ncbi:hypothetical protein McPS_00870 [Marichromatium sp. PS1]
MPEILTRLGIAPERFVEHAGFLLKGFGAAIGAPERLTALAARRECRYLRGVRRAMALFGPTTPTDRPAATASPSPVPGR